MSFGRGVIHARSNKEKVNTNSSTEAEVVGVSNYLPFNIWVRLFIKDQGYKLRENIIYENNESIRTTLSYRSNARRLLHKASTRGTVSQITQRDNGMETNIVTRRIRTQVLK